MAVVKTVEDIRWRHAPGRDGGDFLWGNVHHFRDLNYRLEYGTESERLKTREALRLYGGWDPTYPICGEDPTPAQIALAIEERKATKMFLEMNAALEGSLQPLYQAMLQIFTSPLAGIVDAAGNFLPPLKIGITGNRRANEYPWAMGEVLLDKERCPEGIASLHLGLPCNYPQNVTEIVQVPVDKDGNVAKWVGGKYVKDADGVAHLEGGSYVAADGSQIFVKDGKVLNAEGKAVKGYSVTEQMLHRFSSEAFYQKLRGEVQLRENTTKTTGFLEPSAAENLIAVTNLVRNGAIQADIRKHFGATKTVLGLRYFFGATLAILDQVKKFGLNLYHRWTDKPYLNDDPAAPESQRGKPTIEPTYTIGQGQEKQKVNNRPNPNYLRFDDFDQASFQGIADNAKGAPDELKTVPVGRLAVIGRSIDAKRELEALNAERAKKDLAPVSHLDAKFLKKWIDFVTSGGETTSQGMSTKAAKSWGAGLHCNAVRDAILAVTSNDKEAVKDAEKRADGINGLMAIDLDAYGAMAPGLDKLATLKVERQRELAARFAEMLEAEEVTVEDVVSEANESEATQA